MAAKRARDAGPGCSTGKKREFSPNDHFFGTVRALFEVAFDVVVLLGA